MNPLYNAMTRIVNEQGGFLRDADLDTIAQIDRLHLILIRCGDCRMMIPVQDVRHIAGIIEREGSDYIRDYSLPASSKFYAQYKANPVEAGRRFCSLNHADHDHYECHSDADPGL